MSWNCQQAFGSKMTALAALAPDVAVLCDVPLLNPFPPSLLDDGVSWHAAGSQSAKAIAVAGFRSDLQVRPGAPSACRWGVAVTGQSGYGVLGVWSVPVPGRRYADEVLGLIDEHADWIARGDVIVAGDFNIDAHGVANGAGGARLFAALVGRLSQLGLVSAYHSWTGGSFGAESAMTHVHGRKDDRGFHIDFCFIPAAWRNEIREVVVGDPRRWLEHSDHMPIVVDLAI